MSRLVNNNVANYLSIASWMGITDYPFSMCASFVPVTLTQQDTILSLADANSALIHWELTQRGDIANDPMGITARNTTDQSNSTTNFLVAGQRHYGAAVFTSATSRKGVLDANFAAQATDADSVTVPTPTTPVFVVGKSGRSTNDRALDAYVSEVLLVKVALTDAQIKGLTLGASPWHVGLTKAQIAGYWKIHGHESPERDYSGNGNHLTVNGTLTASLAHKPIIPSSLMQRGWIAVNVENNQHFDVDSGGESVEEVLAVDNPDLGNAIIFRDGTTANAMTKRLADFRSNFQAIDASFRTIASGTFPFVSVRFLDDVEEGDVIVVDGIRYEFADGVATGSNQLVDIAGGVTPALMTEEFADAFNAYPPRHLVALKMSDNEVILIRAVDVVPDDADITVTGSHGEGTLAYAQTDGTARGARRSFAVRVPTAQEVALGAIHFPLAFTPLSWRARIVTTSTGAAINWDGTATVTAASGDAPAILTLSNSGATDWSALTTIQLTVFG